MIYLDDLLAATGGRLVGEAAAREFAGFCYDSRRVQAGELFVAIKTDRGDGHDYIAHAVQDGAAGVLCQSPPELDGFGRTCIVVPDTQAALSDWGRYVIRKYRPQVIGITGSTGKTNTREAIAAVLATRYSVFRNPANYNGRFGLPIALGGLGPQHQVAVLELACDSFGEIAHLADLAAPRVGVVTAVSHAHLAYLDSLERIAEEKGRLIEALPPDGVAILNYDDARVRAMAERTSARVITYGLSPDADLVASDMRPDAEGLRLMLHFAGAGGLGLRILGLGIPPSEQPPNAYRLLGVRPFETDLGVIRTAAERQTTHLRTYQLGEYSDLSQRLLNEVAAARARLTDPKKKAEYDRHLSQQRAAAPPAPAVYSRASPGRPWAVSMPMARA